MIPYSPLMPAASMYYGDYIGFGKTGAPLQGQQQRIPGRIELHVESSQQRRNLGGNREPEDTDSSAFIGVYRRLSSF